MIQQSRNILLFLSLIIIVISCNQKKKNIEVPDAIIHDSTYAIIPHDTSKKYYMYYMRNTFGKNYKIAPLTREDFVVIDSLLNICIIDYNNSVEDNRFKIDFPSKSYKKQVIAILNNKGEKEVWVNCFCNVNRRRGNWRTSIIEVLDGGSCFFNFKVNLSTKKYYDLSVNGEA